MILCEYEIRVITNALGRYASGIEERGHKLDSMAGLRGQVARELKETLMADGVGVHITGVCEFCSVDCNKCNYWDEDSGA